jgi:two-component sensor histidine kinase
MQRGPVTSCLDCSQVFLKVEQAIPCSLILNELVTNALKYAFPNGAKGQIKIVLHEASASLVTLLVSDNGIGLPEGFNWKDSSSMGLPIVDLLVKQIGAKLTVATRPGTEFRIEFHR